MGQRKRKMAESLKRQRAERSFAYLRNCPISARKVRLVADMIRGVEVERALGLLRYSPQGSVGYMEKVLLSAMNNWGQKNSSLTMEESGLFVKRVQVDEGRILKRIRPRAQGRAFRIDKRSSHIMIEIGDNRDRVSPQAQGADASEEAA